MRSTALAKELGVAASTIQYWAREGVLPIASTRPSGIREFDENALKRGQEILDAGGLREWRLQDTQLLTSTDVVGQTPLTYRRLDYWVHAGLISPEVESSGSGTPRLWAPSVVDTIYELLERIDLCPFGHPEV